ncbi:MULTISPECIES: hypothetical protein [unclassified Crossiella]|uniref:hypothetical protein n=1 Tax=unclassified Crossiella TaxID=2620835 RepID=UPI001FFE4529|nr:MULTISPECIES: hypothetical protein [unclassified Crossiella]MCK2236729.1 hypothetical protein [Crossiella sp. S99.2]MCK2250397.1 hypothetical protein [Crossiella sp. S99.1]
MTEVLIPPRQLLLSRRLWIASCVAGLVAVIFRLADRRGLNDMLGQLAPQLTLGQVDGAVNLAVVMTVALRLGVIALFWWLSTRTVQGVEWARVVLTVLGGMSVGLGLLGVLGLVAGSASAVVAQLGIIQVTLSVVVFGLDVAALAMMFHPNSRAYFIGVRRTRPGNTPA